MRLYPNACDADVAVLPFGGVLGREQNSIALSIQILHSGDHEYVGRWLNL